jgi:acetylornithine deacetylase
MMGDAARLSKWVDAQRLRELLVEAVDHYSPTYAEEPVIRVFRDVFREASIPYMLQRVRSPHRIGPRANIVVEIGPQPPALLLVGHVDTVMLWYEGSHRAEVKGNRLEGLGAADTKGGCAAMVEAIRALVDSKRKLRQGVCLGLVVGEEEYGDGAARLAEEIRAPLTIVAEPTQLLPCIAHNGYLEAHLVTHGVRAHAAFPERGRNAIEAMLHWVLRISETVRADLETEAVVVSPREIRGGDAGFVVAENCEAYLDIHLPPTGSATAVEQIIERTRGKILRGPAEYSLRYERCFWSPGFTEQGDGKAIGGLSEAFRRAGQAWAPSVFRSHSDAPRFHEAGSVTVVCGPGDLASAHSRYEWVSLHEVERAAHLYASIVETLCGC